MTLLKVLGNRDNVSYQKTIAVSQKGMLKQLVLILQGLSLMKIQMNLWDLKVWLNIILKSSCNGLTKSNLDH